jgi:hypothetical protein
MEKGRMNLKRATEVVTMWETEQPPAIKAKIAKDSRWAIHGFLGFVFMGTLREALIAALMMPPPSPYGQDPLYPGAPNERYFFQPQYSEVQMVRVPVEKFEPEWCSVK